MFQGKNAVVTGASTGIGRAIAVSLATNGANVALVGRSIEGLKKTQLTIQEGRGNAKIFSADLLKESDIKTLADEILKTYNQVDILVNVAGVWHNKDAVYAGVMLSDTPADQISEVLGVGIRAPFLLTRAILPNMIKRKQGKILQISGTFESGASGWLHYYVSKKAIESFTIGLAEELRSNMIQVNAISPSDTYTESYKKFFPNTPKEAALDPSEIAKLSVFLLSNDADNITGQIIVIRSKFARD